MAFAITQSCCSDASCVSVCPVNCIHPTPDEPDFGTTEMLYVDPRSCIDCGACADACPVDAIFPVESLTGPLAAYAEINRAHFTGPGAAPAGPGAEPDEERGEEPAAARVASAAERPDPGWSEPHFPASLTARAAGLRVAVVGTGPAASYTAMALLTTSAEVTMLDRLPTPGGLIRYGVAPDHQSTKAIADRFATVLRNPRLDLVLNVEVGTHLSHADLMAHHDAVVYAVGATSDRTLGVPGEDLPGSLAARTFVGWYNAQPEVPADVVDLGPASRGRAVVVGNGNVALDMARVLLGDARRGGDLARTDIADHALAALRGSEVTEVVLVARRGPAEAAYSLSELRPLLLREDLDVVVDAGPEIATAIAEAAPGSHAAALQGVPVAPVDYSVGPPSGARRRLVLRFGSVVERVEGADRVEQVRLAPTPLPGTDPGAGPGATADATEPGVAASTVPTGLLLRSVGYRSEPVAGLPFDEVAHTVPHDRGRVVDPATGAVVPATYVVGWIKRGPRGGIGTNRADAAETVAALVEDANAGRLDHPGAAGGRVGRGSRRSFRRLVRARRPEAIGRREHLAIDRGERERGEAQGRPRVKLATLEDLLATARR